MGDNSEDDESFELVSINLTDDEMNMQKEFDSLNYQR